jgi:transcription antitermination factor NusG
MSFWACARLEMHREALGVGSLQRAGFGIYFPRVKECRIRHGRKIVVTPPLFAGYAFVVIELQWHAVRWAPGVLGLIMDGVRPARVPDRVIADIRERERNGLVVLPAAPSLRPGDSVRIIRGVLTGVTGLYSGMRGAERVAVLLALLGTVVLPKADIEPAG